MLCKLAPPCQNENVSVALLDRREQVRTVALTFTSLAPSRLLLAVAAGENKSAHAAPAGAGALRKLEDDTETFAHATVSTELKLALQQAR